MRRFSMDLISEVAAVEERCDASSKSSSVPGGSDGPSGSEGGVFFLPFLLEFFPPGCDSSVGLDHEPAEPSCEGMTIGGVGHAMG